MRYALSRVDPQVRTPLTELVVEFDCESESMKKQQRPMPISVGDWTIATAECDGLAAGMYLLLLGHQWMVGSLPANPGDLCRLLRFDRAAFDPAWAQISHHFEERDGRLINDDLEFYRDNPPPGCKGYGSVDSRIAYRLRADRLAAARRLGTHTQAEWLSLLMFCGNRCVKCGTDRRIEKDHITPLYLGGSDSIENLQPLCRTCNVSKGPDCTDHRNQSWRSIQ